MLRMKWFSTLVIQGSNWGQRWHTLGQPTVFLVQFTVLRWLNLGNSLLKSFSLQYWDEWWLASPCLERALVQRVRWAADARAGVVCDGQVFLLVKSGTWGGSGIRNDEPESQWATFSPPSGTEDFAAGEKLLPGSNVQTQMLEVMTQNSDRC